MNAADVIAIAHEGELVCEHCLASDDERAVFYDAPDARERADRDGYLFAVFVDDLEVGDHCGRCFTQLLEG